MQTLVVSSFTENEISQIADAILAFAGNDKIILFDGPMGAGKTTLIKAMCEKLGVRDETSSPTFAIINTYSCAPSGFVYHFDFYRVATEKEAWGTGCEEYFFSGSYCFVEWPEIIHNLLPENHVKVQVTVNPDQTRTLTLTKA